MNDADRAIIAANFGIMAGALLGWLAPTMVAALDIGALTVWAVYPKITAYRDRFHGYPRTVSTMVRSW